VVLRIFSVVLLNSRKSKYSFRQTPRNKRNEVGDVQDKIAADHDPATDRGLVADRRRDLLPVRELINAETRPWRTGSWPRSARRSATYVSLALTSIEQIYKRRAWRTAAAQEEVKTRSSTT
jgi:hypothetical protein